MPLLPPDPPLTDGVVALGLAGDADVDAVTEACQDPSIPRWTTVPEPYTRADAEGFVAEMAIDWREGNAAAFTFRRPGEPRLDGMISVSIVGQGIGVVGYWTAPWARGRGLATRALVLVGDWAFRDLGLRRLDLATIPGNAASERVARKAGYRGGRLVEGAVNQRGVRRAAHVWTLHAPSHS